MCSEHRVAVLDKVTDFLLFLGKLLIVGIVGRKTFLKAQAHLEKEEKNPLTLNLRRDLLFLLLLWKNQSSGGCRAVSELLLGADTGEEPNMMISKLAD